MHNYKAQCCTSPTRVHQGKDVNSMQVLKLQSTDPHFNLATEEYLLKYTDDEYFMLWQNRPSIIVGRNQNTLAEINYDYVQEHHIPVVRRLTGGGAVFHDLGNINYTFIEKGDGKFGNYSLFSQPVIEVLRSLGVPAELQGRNDLVINGLKFSGNAQVAWHGRVMHHGTLLFSSDTEDMTQALKVNPLKIQSKGIKSVRARVTNISEHLEAPITIDAFWEMIFNRVLHLGFGRTRAELSKKDLQHIQKICDDKYATWAWNFGFEKEYSFRKETLFPTGLLEANLNINREGNITALRFYGDYFGRMDVGTLENWLIGTSYEPSVLRKRLSGVNVNDYFSGISADDLLTALF